MGARRVFLSHNKSDAALARRLGANLVLLGADVWFDEWQISAGDSIPGALNSGLENFSWFLIVWSAHAATSRWVRAELNTAITKAIADDSAKIVVCKVDETPLPPLISDRRYIDFSEPARAIPELAAEFLGTRARRARLMAIQEAFGDLDAALMSHPAAGTYVCCPKCGAEETLVPWHSTDYDRDDEYAGLECTECGWNEGGEV